MIMLNKKISLSFIVIVCKKNKIKEEWEGKFSYQCNSNFTSPLVSPR